jgi:hypothetical protein
MSQQDYPTEIIELPSKGLCYPEKHPLAKGSIEIKYMTAKEEEILTSQNLIRRGVVLDKLFESIIVDSKIDPNDIFIGDKNAIMLATRVLGYGADYVITTEDDEGNKQETHIDLTKISIKEIDHDKLNRENSYEFTTPVTKTKLKFKLLTHGDEAKIDMDVKAMKRLSKDGVSGELTTRYRYMITAVNGDESLSTIIKFINNKFLTRDTKAFRKYLKEIQPDVIMEYDYVNPITGESEVRPIPMGVGFFWPTE